MTPDVPVLPSPNENQSRSPKKRQDEQEFPIRVRVLTSELGYGKQYDEIYKWLEEHAGRGSFAWHSDTLPGADAIALYFKDVGLVQPLLDRFGLVLAVGPSNLRSI